MVLCCFSLFFFFKAPAPPEIYTLSLHDALPISVLAEALRRLAILRRHRDEPTWARELCQRSYEVARQIGKDRKSTRLNSSHVAISYAVFCLKKKKKFAHNYTRKTKLTLCRDGSI